MGRPAVVGVVGVAGLSVAEGTLVAIDGTSGVVVLGGPRVTTAAAGPGLRRLLAWAEEVSGGSADRAEPERLGAAQAVIGRPAPAAGAGRHLPRSGRAPAVTPSRTNLP